jgi:hypothetical protein
MMKLHHYVDLDYVDLHNLDVILFSLAPLAIEF